MMGDIRGAWAIINSPPDNTKSQTLLFSLLFLLFLFDNVKIGSHNVDISQQYLTRAQKNFHANDIPLRYHSFFFLSFRSFPHFLPIFLPGTTNL